MTTLAVNSPRRYVPIGTDVGDYPVIATDIVYEGAAVGDNASGYARPLVAGDAFLGFAELKADNAAGAAGDINVRVRRKGTIQLAVAALAIADFGRPVYASDDNAFNLDGIGTFVGYVVAYVSSGVGLVAFDADRKERVQTIAIPVALAGVTAADVVTSITPGFDGRIKDMEFVVTTPVTTGGDGATLNAEVGTTDLTGGTIALTSANCTPLGAVIGAAAITAGSAFKKTDTISIEAASVTAFAEGAGVLLIYLGG